MLQQWAQRPGIRWLGPSDDMPSVYARADAVVLPSYREGMPRSLLEAAAMGLPAVATDVPGCREVVTHGVDGLLVPPKDAAALAAAIARLHDNPHLRTRLARAARAKALAHFDERIVIDRTLDVYRELLPHFA